MKLSRNGYLIAGAVLLGALAMGLWKLKTASTSSTGPTLPALSEKPHNRQATSPEARPEQDAPITRIRPTEEKKDLQQIDEWVTNDAITPEAAAKNLWQMAADPSRTAAVRNEAITHAMNLTDDETFKAVVIPLIGKKDLWPDDLGEKILDDLYNRPDALKLEGTLALFQNSTDELHNNVRELLSFELSDPDTENLSDTELIRRGTERVNSPPEPETPPDN